MDSGDSGMVVSVGTVNGEEFAAAMIPTTISTSEDGLFSVDGPVNDGALDADDELIETIRSTDFPDGTFPVPDIEGDSEEGHYWDKVVAEDGTVTLVGFNVISSATPWATIHDKLDNGGGEFDEYMKKADDVLEANGFIRHFGH